MILLPVIGKKCINKECKNKKLQFLTVLLIHVYGIKIWKEK